MGENATLNMAALSNEAPPSEQKSQSLICKVSTSLQLPLEGPFAIETVSVLRRVLGLRMHTGWSSLMVLMLFEQNKHIYDTVVVRFYWWFKYEI